jgi:hypothetical protein
MSSDHPSADLLRDWFNRGQSGCKFASHLASGDPRLAFVVHLDEASSLSLHDLDSQVELAAAKGDACLLVLPRATSNSDIVDLAQHLERGDRWQVKPHPHPTNPAVCGLGIRYRTGAGEWSSAMGFAPSGTMPVTRRAPYLALALWGGGHENPAFKFSRPGTVNMADVAVDLTGDGYDNMWDASQASTRRRLADPAFDVVWLRNVAFCLPRELTDSRWPLP